MKTRQKKNHLTDILIFLEEIPTLKQFYYQPVLSAYVTLEIICAPKQSRHKFNQQLAIPPGNENVIVLKIFTDMN